MELTEHFMSICYVCAILIGHACLKKCLYQVTDFVEILLHLL
jgi:hypothetical protein